MIQLTWVVAGVIIGMLIACVMVPPPRNEKKLPVPHDPDTTFHTDNGCVHVISTEVPCGEEADSLNVIASLNKK
jgi:hypothetical protein